MLTVTAVAAMLRGDGETARRLLAKVFPLSLRNAYALILLRNLDLQQGHVDAARRRYATAYPEFLATVPPKVDGSNYDVALDLAIVLQKTGDSARAALLLDRAEARGRSLPRLGGGGYGITDVEIHALRGQKREALSALRAAEKAGWRGGDWPLRYYRDLDPNLASIRDDPEFKSVFADIERDMARQRAELAARPKDAPLEVGTKLAD